MKLSVIAVLFGFAHALTSTEDATYDETDKHERSVWAAAPAKYNAITAKGCTRQTDCAANHVCIQHQWAYNGQFEGARGCWHKSVCEPGRSSYYMQDDRQLQFFCDNAARSRIGGNYGQLP